MLCEIWFSFQRHLSDFIETVTEFSSIFKENRRKSVGGGKQFYGFPVKFKIFFNEFVN